MTIKDVAKLTGLSVATISRVLNEDEKVADRTRDKVLAAIKEVGYIPNLLGRNLRKSSTKMVYVLLPSIDNPFFSGILIGIESAARMYDYRVVICETFGREKRYQDFVQEVKKKLVDGLIFLSPTVSDVIPNGNDLAVVVCGETSDDYDCLQVDIDNHLAAYDATKYLLGKGRQRIAFAGGDTLSGRLRLDGYKKALIESGITPDEDLIFGGAYYYNDGLSCAKRLIKSGARVDAVLGAGDLVAIGFVRELESNGYRVPEDVAVMGFDNLEYSEMLAPQLSTVMQPRVDMGKLAFRKLYDRMQGVDTKHGRTLLEHQIIERGST